MHSMSVTPVVLAIRPEGVLVPEARQVQAAGALAPIDVSGATEPLASFSAKQGSYSEAEKHFLQSYIQFLAIEVNFPKPLQRARWAHSSKAPLKKTLSSRNT